jgi:uncharacterized membrane protein
LPLEFTKDDPSPSRLESFSDGVIAVILTIMVLDFKLPHDSGPKAFAATILPTLAVYLLSFTFTGIYWINHHHLIHRLKRVDAPILWANLALLFFLSLLPFATSYVLNEKFDAFSVAVYAGALFLCGAAFILLSGAVTRHFHRSGIANAGTIAIQQAEWRKGLISVGMYGLAVPLAYWHPFIAAADLVLITLLWIVPGFLLPRRGGEKTDAAGFGGSQ